MAKSKRFSGFTLIELLFVCGILAVLLSFAVPSFAQMMTSVRLGSEADAFFNSVLLTRSEAVTRNSRAVMCKSSDGKFCAKTGGWEQGWIVFHDVNNNAELDAGEAVVLHKQAAESQIKISGNGPVASYVSYTEAGRTKLASGAVLMGTLTFCSASPNAASEARQIVISSGGRPRSVKTTVNQCV